MIDKQYEIGEVLDTKVLVVPCVITQQRRGNDCRTRKRQYCTYFSIVIQDLNGLHIMGYCKPKDKAYIDGSALLETFRRHKKS